MFTSSNLQQYALDLYCKMSHLYLNNSTGKLVNLNCQNGIYENLALKVTRRVPQTARGQFAKLDLVDYKLTALAFTLGACLRGAFGRAMSEGEPITETRPQDFARFLAYSAAVTVWTPVGELGSRTWVSAQDAYAVMAAINERFLQLNEVPSNVSEQGFATIDLPSFYRLVKSGGAVERHQLDGALTKLEARGLLTCREPSDLDVSSEFFDLLEGHARAAFKFFAKADTPTAWTPERRDWLNLNSAIFEAFFFGTFGLQWRKLRKRINTQVSLSAQQEKESKGGNKKRMTVRDHLSHNPAQWVLVNVLAGFGPSTDFEIIEVLVAAGLSRMAPDTEALSQGIKTLKAGNVIRPDAARRLHFTKSFETGVANFVRATVEGMAVLDSTCRQWKDGQLTAA